MFDQMDKKITIPSPSFQTLVICGVRYALGRRTYMPSDISRIVQFNIKNIDNNTLRVIHRDIKEHGGFNNNSYTEVYGDYCDYITWMNLLSFLDAECEKREMVDLP